MIGIAEGNEFTVLTADFIETISHRDKFILNIWINGENLPFTFTEDFDFYFMQEGFRVSKDNEILWVFYDTINSLRLVYES